MDQNSNSNLLLYLLGETANRLMLLTLAIHWADRILNLMRLLYVMSRWTIRARSSSCFEIYLAFVIPLLLLVYRTPCSHMSCLEALLSALARLFKLAVGRFKLSNASPSRGLLFGFRLCSASTTFPLAGPAACRHDDLSLYTPLSLTAQSIECSSHPEKTRNDLAQSHAGRTGGLESTYQH